MDKQYYFDKISKFERVNLIPDRRDIDYFVDSDSTYGFGRVCIEDTKTTVAYCMLGNDILSYVAVDDKKHNIVSKYLVESSSDNMYKYKIIFNNILSQQLTINGNILDTDGIDPECLIILLLLLNKNIDIFYILTDGLTITQKMFYFLKLNHVPNRNKIHLSQNSKIAFIGGHICVVSNTNNIDLLLFDSLGVKGFKDISRCINNNFVTDSNTGKFNIKPLNDMIIQGQHSCFLMSLGYLQLLNGKDEKSKYFQEHLEELFINGRECNPIGNLLVIEQMLYILNKDQQLLNIDFKDNTFTLHNSVYFTEQNKIHLQDGNRIIPINNLININNVNLLIQNQLDRQNQKLTEELEEFEENENLITKQTEQLTLVSAQQATPNENKNSTLLATCCGNDSDGSYDHFNIEEENTQPPQQEIQNQNNNKQQENSNTPQMTTLPHIKKQLDKKEHDKTSQVVNL